MSCVYVQWSMFVLFQSTPGVRESRHVQAGGREIIRCLSELPRVPHSRRYHSVTPEPHNAPASALGVWMMTVVYGVCMCMFPVIAASLRVCRI